MLKMSAMEKNEAGKDDGVFEGSIILNTVAGKSLT